MLGLDAFPGRSICILEASVQDGAALRAAAALQTGLAIVDERLVIDAAQLVAAAAASLRAHRDSAMVTSHLHAELLYRMSPSTNVSARQNLRSSALLTALPTVQIAESLRTIGVRSDTTAALLVSFDATPSEVRECSVGGRDFSNGPSRWRVPYQQA